jgi:methylmalonyl-CoA mutase N-terminal domain/subunit
MRERYGAADAISWALQVTAYGHGRETRKEPLNNIARIAIGSLAYYLAGIQTLYTASYDEVLQVPSDEAVKVAVRTQQIIASELGLGLTADPLGGSYYVESLTSDVERGIQAELQEVEARGGAVACIENGYMREVITDGAVRRQQRYEAGLRPMIGVDRHVSDEDDSWSVRPRASQDGVDEVRSRDVAELKRTREQRRVQQALSDVHSDVRRGANVVPSVLEAVRSYATIGEIAEQFRDVLGEWQPDQTF